MKPPVRSIHDPLLPGAALMILPAGMLVRWPARRARPALGSAFEGVTIDVNPEQLPTVQTLLFSEDALARCDAAKALPFGLLRRAYSYQQAKGLCDASERLAPEIREQIRESGVRVSLYRLTRAAYAPNLKEQIRRVGL